MSPELSDLEEIYQYLDWLAYNKINKFHWHLTDDQGWRIEIKNILNLPQKIHGEDQARLINLVLAQAIKDTADIIPKSKLKGIVKYAAERNRSYSEIDLPGQWWFCS